MRISDWSSDVCSSDLSGRWPLMSYRVQLAALSPQAANSVQVVSSKARHRRPEKKANMSVSGAGAQAIRMATGLILACRRYKCFGCQAPFGSRSEEHTSELQSLMRISYAVFCLKKKTTHY